MLKKVRPTASTATSGEPKTGTQDRVSYSESVKLNIGDYESRQINISYSTDVEEDETYAQAVERARLKVRKSVVMQEKRIRIAAQQHVDFDTKSKIMRDDV